MKCLILVTALAAAGCDSLDVDIADAGPPDPSGRAIADGNFLARGDELGAAVAVSDTTLVAGAPGTDLRVERDTLVYNAGAVHIFEREGDAWGMRQQLTAPVPTPGARFGASVSLSGDLLAVGAPGDSAFGDQTGTVFTFRRDGDVWTPVPQVR